MKRILPPLLLLLNLLAACAPLETVTIQPTPTRLAAEVTQPTTDLEPAAKSDAQPEAVPTLPTSQPPLSDQPQTPDQPGKNSTIPGTAEIAILRPGQYSRLVSPIRLIASFSNPDDTNTFINLYGEDGRVLAERKFEILPYDDPVNGNVITDLEFTIEGLNEVGRLEFKVYDQFGRLRALNSVNLILLSSGDADRNYAPEDGERILQQIPFPGQIEFEGGSLLLSGLVRLTPTTDSSNPAPLVVHLVSEDGEIVAEGRAPVVLTVSDLLGQYVAEIPYQVDQPTSVLLTFSIIEGRLQTPAYVKTFPITLLP
jgi:hypothetical protein